MGKKSIYLSTDVLRLTLGTVCLTSCSESKSSYQTESQLVLSGDFSVAQNVNEHDIQKCEAMCFLMSLSDIICTVKY